MLRRIQLLVLLSFSFLNFNMAYAADVATESVVSGRNAQGDKMFLVLYQEGKTWQVDEIIERAGGWEDLISRKYYNYRSQAESVQLQMQASLTQIQTETPRARIQAGDIVLKGGSIWPTTQTWSWEWEKKYGEWLTQNMNADFYQKYQIATDCADVAYSARWIFARINGLPAANRLSGNGALLTNQSARAEWQNLPTAKNWYEDKRFRAALNYLLNMTYTHALMRDSYPVAITPENFLPGIHHLDLHEASGHTQLVHRVDLSDKAMIPYYIIQSTTPRQVRVLSEAMVWGSALAQKGQNGFLRILWPKVKNGTYSLEKPENMPGYSLEQYAKDFIREENRPNFLEVLLRLKPGLDFVGLVKTGYSNLTDMFKARVGIVDEGYSHCPNNSCAPGSSEYDSWSTPSRDHRITDGIEQLAMLGMVALPDPLNQEVAKAMKAALDSVAVTLNGQDYTLRSLVFAWQNEMYSSDPNDEPGVRWGLEPEYLSKGMQNNLNKILTARKKTINPDDDDRLRGYLPLAKKYCVSFSADQCMRLQAELVKPVTVPVLSQTRTLQEWLEYSLWLNSDPLQTPVNQWGALRAQSKFMKLSEDMKAIRVTDEGVGSIESITGEKRIGVMGVNGLEDKSLPTGFSWQFLVMESSVAWAKGPQGQVLRYDFKTQDERIFTIPAAGDIEILRARDSSLIIADSQQTSSLVLQNGQLVSVWSEALAGVRMIGNYYLAKRTNGQWFIFDFTQAVPTVTPSSEDLLGAEVFKANAKYVGISKNGRKIFFERITGRIFDVSKLGQIEMWSDGLTRAVVWDPQERGSMALTLNDQFQVVAKTRIGNYATASGEYLLVYGANASPPKTFHMKGEDLIEMPTLNDEEGDWGIYPPWKIAQLKNGKFRVRKLDGSQTIYEGDPLLLVGSRSSPEWAYTFSPGNYAKARLISLKDPKGPAAFTGAFLKSGHSINMDVFEEQNQIDRGIILSYQGFRFWVELPKHNSP